VSSRSLTLVALAALVALLVIHPAAAAVSHRIVSLSPTATESLFAIGAGAQVVAVDDQSDYPKRAPRTSLSGYTPNVEAIAGYRPDLVVLSDDANDVVSGLRKLGIRVLLQPAAKNLAETYAEIRQLGAATGHARSARALVKRMQKAITKAIKSTPRRRLSVYHELTPDLYSATSNTFIGRIYKLFGLRNIGIRSSRASTSWPRIRA
jgi:iron complex transport system substrate-binding protein